MWKPLQRPGRLLCCSTRKWNCTFRRCRKSNGWKSCLLPICGAILLKKHAKKCCSLSSITHHITEGKSRLSSGSSAKKEKRSIIFIFQKKTAERFLSGFYFRLRRVPACLSSDR